MVSPSQGGTPPFPGGDSRKLEQTQFMLQKRTSLASWKATVERSKYHHVPRLQT